MGRTAHRHLLVPVAPVSRATHRSLALLLALAGCGAPQASNQNAAEPVPAGAPAQAGAPFDASLHNRELMLHVVQYAADGVWERQGYVVDATGEHSLLPKNDEE
jgi:hypothetical protein